MDIFEQVYKELTIAYHSIIILEDENLDNLQNSIESLKLQKPSPKHITIVRTQNSNAKSSDLRILLDKHKIPWKMQILTEKMPIAEAVDLVLSAPLPSYQKKLQLYMCIDSGDTLPESFMEKLNHKINKELLQFAMIEIKPNTHSIIAPISVHKFMGGNRLKEEYGDEKTTLKQEIQKDEECTLKIMKAEEIL